MNNIKVGDLVMNDCYRHKYFCIPGIVLNINSDIIHNVEYSFAKVLYENYKVIFWNIKNLKVISTNHA